MYFFPSIAIKGGLEKILVDKMNYLVEHFGYDVFIVTYDQNVHPLAYELNQNVHHIDLNINFIIGLNITLSNVFGSINE